MKNIKHLLVSIVFFVSLAGAAGPGHIWHWEDYVAKNNLWWHFGRFSAVVEGIDPSAEGFQAEELPHPTRRVRSLKGRRTLLMWLRDLRNTWQTELAEGKAPERITGAMMKLPAGFPAAESMRVRTYDPWQDKWVPAIVKNGEVALPEFSRSLVIRVDLGRARVD